MSSESKFFKQKKRKYEFSFTSRSQNIFVGYEKEENISSPKKLETNKEQRLFCSKIRLTVDLINIFSSHSSISLTNVIRNRLNF